MKDKLTKPSHEQIVLDFDEWLFKNVPRFLDLDTITVIKEITNKWRELRNSYIEYLIKGFNDIKIKR